MLGYIKPFQDELKVSELRRYRSVYCGVCKRIGALQGQFERMAISFDVTFLAIFLLAFVENEEEGKEEFCITHPFQKRMVAKHTEVLDYAAGLCMYLVYSKALDDELDGDKIRSFLGKTFFRSGAKNFSHRYPDLTKVLDTQLKASWELEEELSSKLVARREERIDVHIENRRDAPREARRDARIDARIDDNNSKIKFARGVAEQIAAASGKMLAQIFREGAPHTHSSVFKDERFLDLLGTVGQYLGEWVYLIDAFDDWEEDQQKGLFNPFSNLARDEFLTLAPQMLEEKVSQIDHTAALFPFYKDAGIMENILHLGLRNEIKRVSTKYS